MTRLVFGVLLCMPLCGAYASKATVTFAGASGSTQTNITLAFSFSDVKLKTVANGGQIQNTVTRNGFTVPADFVFTNDSTCASVTGSYTWGFDGDYSATAGTGHGWIMIPSYTTGGVTPTVCIGNSAVSTYQGGAAGAEFDSHTAGAWHLPNAVSLSGVDFSANGNSASSILAAAGAGKIDGGALTSASNRSVSVPSSASLAFSGACTIEAWFLDTDSTNYRAITAKETSGSDRSISVFLAIASTSSVYYNNVGLLTLSSGWSFSTWTHFALTDDGTTIKVFLNGASVYSGASGGGAVSNTGALVMGYNASESTFQLTGGLDEVRIINTSRSGNWIATEYANQNNPPAVGSFTALAAFVANQSVISIQ